MTRKAILILILGTFPVLVAPISQAADQCSMKVCVKVFTDPRTGEVVITAKKNGHKATPKPKPKPRPKPSSKPSSKPIVQRPKPVRVYKPRARVIRKAASAGPSLADRLTQLIPVRAMHIQPSGEVLVQVPANFWTDTGEKFQAHVLILGVPVSVDLTPTFEWDFGDGTPTFATSLRGAPFPNQEITHTYRQPGHYQATVRISWAGTWSSDGATFPVLGNNIVQFMQVPVFAVAGPTKFTK